MTPPRTIPDGDVLELSDLNLAETAREMVRWHSQYEMRETTDLLCVAGNDGFPVGYTNCVMALGTASPADPAAVLASAGAFFYPMGRGYTLWTRDHLDGELAAHAQSAGLTHLSDTPGMVLDAPIVEPALPQGVRVAFAETAGAMKEFAAVVPRAYESTGLPIAISSRYFEAPERMLHPHVLSVVGYLNDEPVATALAILSHGIAGLCWVGTVEAARGMGIGEACTRAVGNLAFDRGARCLVLQASAQGEPIYLRMGYRVVTRYAWYVSGPKDA
ncbi:MAG: GNAT family N-acetyltransferase [Deltaproteobacteria bacterium]|nr:GNAT family N-acetyltransferase [Deltaproteobacteria bacterium]